MANPHTSEQFGDLLDPRFQRIFDDRLRQVPDMVMEVYTDAGTNGRNNMMWSEVGTMPDWAQFTGQVSYQSRSQGYDVTATPIEFTSGFQIERKLFDDDQYNIMDQRPRGLATSYVRTRQSHAARVFNNAFAVDTMFYSHSEGVGLCNNSHTTTSGASTASGFDNLTTAALTHTAVTAARKQMVQFRGDQAEIIAVTPDELWYPVALYDRAQEILGSRGRPEDATNAVNIHMGQFRGVEWIYMNDTNNWFMVDSMGRRDNLFWTDRIGVEFAMVEDFDTLIAKWRGYARYAMARVDWRFILGSQVS